MTEWINTAQLTDDKIGLVNRAIAIEIHDCCGIKVEWKNIAVKEL